MSELEIRRQTLVLSDGDGNKRINVITGYNANGRYTGEVGFVDIEGNIVLDEKSMQTRGLDPQVIRQDVEISLGKNQENKPRLLGQET